MNTQEYRRKTHPEDYRRSWPYTLVSLGFLVIICAVLIAYWVPLTRDPYTIGFAVVPLVIIAIVLVIAVFHGRRGTIGTIWAGILEMLIWW